MKKLTQLKILLLVIVANLFSTFLQAKLYEKSVLPPIIVAGKINDIAKTKVLTTKRSLVNITPELLAFFVQKNFRFMTRAPQRQPTLYFEDDQGNIGRIRQGHGQGKSLVFASANIHPHRVFFTQQLAAAFIENPADRPEYVEAASLFPAKGEKVFEFFGDWNPLTGHYENDHGSSGNIVKIGGQMPNFNIYDYTNFVVFW